MEKATERILEYYADQTPEESIEEQIQRIDASCRKKAMAKAIPVGTIGCLLLGVGMCCTMVWTDYFAAGVAVGIVGLILVCVAYPLYARSLASLRQQSKSEVLRLAESLGVRSRRTAPTDRR